MKGLLLAICLVMSIQVFAQDYPALFPDTTVLGREPSGTDSSSKAISSGWARRNLLLNQNAYKQNANSWYNKAILDSGYANYLQVGTHPNATGAGLFVTYPPASMMPYDSSFFSVDSIGGDVGGVSWMVGAKSRFIEAFDHSSGNNDYWGSDLFIDTTTNFPIDFEQESDGFFTNLFYYTVHPTYNVHPSIHHRGGTMEMVDVVPHGNFYNYQFNQGPIYYDYISGQFDAYDSLGGQLSPEGYFKFLVDSTGAGFYHGIHPYTDSTTADVLGFASSLGNHTHRWSNIYTALPAYNSGNRALVFENYTDNRLETGTLSASDIPGLGGNFIQNLSFLKGPKQAARYAIVDNDTNSTAGDIIGGTSANYLWNGSVSPSEGALYSAHFNNTTHTLGYSSESMGNSITVASDFNRLTLNGTSNSRVEIDGSGASPHTFSALQTQVYLPNIGSGLADTISDVASLTIKSAYQDGGTSNSVGVINYYQLFMEPSSDNLYTNPLVNKYGIYQAGASDTNVLKGPLSYANKFSSSPVPTIGMSGGSGAAGATGVSITGTNDGGVVTFTTGSTPVAHTGIFSVSFSGFSFPHGCSVVLFPANSSAAILTGSQSVYATGSTNSWTLISGVTPLAASTTYSWNYIVQGY